MLTQSSANMKSRSKKPRKRSSSTRTLLSRISILPLSYVYLDRLGEAERPFSEPPSAKSKSLTFCSMRYDIAFLKGDEAGMEREVALG